MEEARKKQIANTGNEAIAKLMYAIVYRISSMVVALEMINEREGEIVRVKKEIMTDAFKINELADGIITFPIFRKTEKEKIINVLDLLEIQVNRLKLRIESRK